MAWILTNPSYTKLFQTEPQGGGGGGGGRSGPYHRSALRCTNVKFCKVLEIPFMISENKKVSKEIFCVWQLFDNMVLFANNCQNDYEKQVTFQMLPETKNFKVLK